MKFNARQQAFIDNYLSDPEMSGTQAAINAGYSKRTAASIASQLLAKPEVQEVIRQEQAERSKRTEIDKDFVLTSLARSLGIAMGDQPMTVTKVVEGQQVTTKVRKTNLTAANKAIEMMGRHLGMFIDKKEVETNVTLDDAMMDIAKRNAENRKSLLPKDNIDFDDDDEYADIGPV